MAMANHDINIFQCGLKLAHNIYFLCLNSFKTSNILLRNIMVFSSIFNAL